MTLLFKVLKLPDTSCVVIQLLIMIVNRIMLIYKIKLRPLGQGNTLLEFTQNYATLHHIIVRSASFSFVITFHTNAVYLF